jgi:hypothetical protein
MREMLERGGVPMAALTDCCRREYSPETVGVGFCGKCGDLVCSLCAAKFDIEGGYGDSGEKPCVYVSCWSCADTDEIPQVEAK